MREKPLIEGRADTRRRGPGGHGHGHGRMMPGEKARDFTGSLRKMLAFMGQFKALVFIVLAFAVGSTVFNIVGPKVLSEATTALFEGMGARLAGTGGIDFDFIARVLVATFALYVLSAACAWVQGWVMSYVSQQTCYRLRKAIAEKIDRMPFGFFDKNSNGDTLSRITNDVDTLGQSLNQGITQLVTSVTTVVGVVAMMLWINWVMTLITLVMVPLSLTLVAAVVKRSQKYFCEQQAQLGAINGQVEEVFSGHAVVKACCREEEVVEAYLATNERLYESAWRSQFLSGLMKPVMDFVGNLGYVAVAIAGAFLAVAGAITVGDIQAFVQYVKNFTQPITQLAQVSNVLQQMAAAAERIFAFVEMPEEEPETSSVRAACVPGDVVFDHVKFGYDENAPGDRRFLGVDRRRADGRHRRADGRGQDHAHQSAHALLRRAGRIDQARRRRHALVHARRRARSVRHGASGRMAVQRHRSREHPLRQARRDRRGGRAGGARRVRASFHHDVAGRLRLRDKRRRVEHLAGPTSAADHRARSWRTGACSSSMRPPPRSTRAPSRASGAPWTTWCAAGRRSSSRIAFRLSATPTSSLVVDGGDVVEQGTHEELIARGGFFTRGSTKASSSARGRTRRRWGDPRASFRDMVVSRWSRGAAVPLPRRSAIMNNL